MQKVQQPLKDPFTFQVGGTDKQLNFEIRSESHRMEVWEMHIRLDMKVHLLGSQ